MNLYALKLLREDYGSLRTEGRLVYPKGQWITAPKGGPGIYCAPVVGGRYEGLTAGGTGHYLAYCEVKGKRDVGPAYPTPEGTMCVDALKVLRVVKWDAVNAKYRTEWDAVNAKYRTEWDAMYVKYRPEWDAVYAKYQTEWDALWSLVVATVGKD